MAEKAARPGLGRGLAGGIGVVVCWGALLAVREVLLPDLSSGAWFTACAGMWIAGWAAALTSGWRIGMPDTFGHRLRLDSELPGAVWFMCGALFSMEPWPIVWHAAALIAGAGVVWTAVVVLLAPGLGRGRRTSGGKPMQRPPT